MDENLLNSYDEAIKSKYTSRLYKTCFDIKNDLSDIKMATCLNLKPKNNFQILENLVDNNPKKKKLIDINQRPKFESASTSIDIKDYKKLLMLKQKLENSFRSKINNSNTHKSVFIDLKTSTTNSSVLNPKSANSEKSKRDGINKHLAGNSTGLLNRNRKYLRKKFLKNQQQQEEKHYKLKEIKIENNLDELNATETINEKNTKNSSNSSIHEEIDDEEEIDEENDGETEPVNADSDYSSSNSQNNTNQQTNNYDLDCLKSLCDTNKDYLKKLYNNFDIPILYCDSESNFNQANKTDLIDEREELQELEDKDKPILKMNPIQFNYKNIRQPRSLINQQPKVKKPHWVNIATVGKINDIKRPVNYNRKITSHLIAQKPEPSLIFVSTFSSLSSLSEYLKTKKPNDEPTQDALDTSEIIESQIRQKKRGNRKSLNKIHSEEIYSDVGRLKSKSAVVSPTSYYSVNQPLGQICDEGMHKRSFSDLSGAHCKLPDLISAPKLYVLNKNALNTTVPAKPKQSFITQTQVYKKLSELQRQNTFEYLKFVSVKNLKESNNDQQQGNKEDNKFIAPKISKKILLKENSADQNELSRNKFRSAVYKNLKSTKGRKKTSDRKDDFNKTDDYFSSRSSSLSSTNDLDVELDELKFQKEDEHYEEEEDDDEDRDPDFVITQNSKSDQIPDQDENGDSEPRLRKSQPLYTHVLTSSSQLREFYQYTHSSNPAMKNLNLVLKNGLNNIQFRDAWEFMYYEKQVRKLHQKVFEKLEKQRSLNDIRLINFISSNLNYNNRSNFDCYKFYERAKTSNLLQNLRYKLFDQITLANRLKNETLSNQNSDIMEKSISFMDNSQLNETQQSEKTDLL